LEAEGCKKGDNLVRARWIANLKKKNMTPDVMPVQPEIMHHHSMMVSDGGEAMVPHIFGYFLFDEHMLYMMTENSKT
jgi:hypothetical protein